MRFLIIGASGFIGRHIFSFAKEKGHQVLGTQFSARRSNLVSFNLLTDRIADLLPEAFLESNDQICAVICAAIPKIDLCCKNRDISYKVNVVNTIRLLEDLKGLGIKTAFLSSEAVYDGKRGYYDESIQPSPINEYGRQKAEMEAYIITHLPQDLVIRLSVIVGDEPTEPHLLSQWYEWIRNGKPIACIAGQIFSPTYVKDVARGVIESFYKQLSGLYNLANSEFFAREELAHQFLVALDRKAEIVVKPVEEFGFPERRSMKTYLDSSKFNKAADMRFTPMREVFSSFAAKI